MFLHIMLDIFTHCGKEYEKTDQSCMWPFKQLFGVRKLGTYFGFWEYRIATGVLKPKPAEAVICLVSLGLWTGALLFL